MTLRAGPILGVLVLMLVAGTLIVWSGGRDARPASPAPRPVAAVPAAPDGLATAVAPLEAAPAKLESRRALGAPAAPELVDPQPSADTLGTLRVHVRSRETGEPLGRVRLLLELTGKARGAVTLVDGPSARPGESPLTDDHGFAELQVPIGVIGILRAGGGRTIFWEETFVMPFSEGEVRDVVLDLPTRSGPRFFGRVVSKPTDEPLSGATISIADGLVELRADSDGCFEAFFQSPRPIPAAVLAPGHGLALISIDRGHESRDDALLIQLSESARLDALVLARGGAPVDGVRVRLGTKPWHVAQAMGPEVWARLDDLEWSCRTGPDGRCSIVDLPPFAPLTVEFEKEGLFKKAESDAIALAPGEVRELVCRIGGGATIAGRLIEEGGDGVEGVEIWLVPAEAAVPSYLRTGYDGPAASTTTDRTGRFELTDVAEGAWWVGPAPGGPFPTRAEVVEVTGGVADRELLLVAPRDLFIEGRVVDTSGAPLARVHVSLTKEGEQAWLGDDTEEDGLFAIGPLARGAFEVSAWGSRTHVRSDPVPVEAGNHDVRIQLHLGGGIAGTLVSGTTGQPANGQAWLSAADKRADGWNVTWPDDAGAFDFEALEPGLYDLAASTERQEFALLEGIRVEAGATPKSVRLEARPGATLRLRYEGDATFAGFSVRLGEVLVAAGQIRRGAASNQVVPAAAIRVEGYWEGSEDPEVHDLTLAVGEERELVLGKAE